MCEVPIAMDFNGFVYVAHKKSHGECTRGLSTWCKGVAYQHDLSARLGRDELTREVKAPFWIIVPVVI
jgi:hypothetical protein